MESIDTTGHTCHSSVHLHTHSQANADCFCLVFSYEFKLPTSQAFHKVMPFCFDCRLEGPCWAAHKSVLIHVKVLLRCVAALCWRRGEPMVALVLTSYHFPTYWSWKKKRSSEYRLHLTVWMIRQALRHVVYVPTVSLPWALQCPH